MEYVACQMRSGSDPTHQACVEETGMLFYHVEECAAGDFAIKQMLTFEQMTGKNVFAFQTFGEIF